MKRIISIILSVFALVVILSGCAPKLENEKALTEADYLETVGEYLDEKGEVIALENLTADNWYKVRLTYPVDFVTEGQLETYKEAYEQVSVDENNRVTVVMSRQQYENLKDSSEASIEEELAACKSGELSDVLPGISDIKADELYSEILIYINGDVNREKITPLGALLCKEIYTYKTLIGNNSETRVIFLDSETEAVYGELTYKQVYESIKKQAEAETES